MRHRPGGRLSGPGSAALSTIIGEGGANLAKPVPALHVVPDGADCVARLPSPGAVPAPEPSSSGAADKSSEIVTLDHLPALSGGDDSAGAYVPAIRAWGRSQQDVFAGLFVANGHLYVGLAKDPVENLAIIRRLVDRPQLIRAVAATYSLAAIMASMESLNHDHRALEERGIHLTAWDPMNTTIDSTWPSRRSGRRFADYLRRHYGGPMVTVVRGVYACPV